MSLTLAVNVFTALRDKFACQKDNSKLKHQVKILTRCQKTFTG